MNIGVFDSGLGGLSIFREILDRLPEYNYLYFGDNARVPYGGRSNDLIYTFTKDAVNFLMQNDCELVILACNTATANALRQLQQEYLPANYPDRKILGVIRPVVEMAVADNVQRIGVMATRATIAANSYPNEIHKISPNTKVFQQACPLLVPIIEEDEMNWEGCDLVIQKYLKPLLAQNIDSLILGCTHYGLIEGKIRKYLPKNVQVISQGKSVAEKLAEYLAFHPEIENTVDKKSKRTYFATDLNQRYGKLTKLFLQDHFTQTAKLQFVNL